MTAAIDLLVGGICPPSQVGRSVPVTSLFANSASKLRLGSSNRLEPDSLSRRDVVRGLLAGCFTAAIPTCRVVAGPAPNEASMAGAELRQSERRAALCSASNVAGTGLRGEYFADIGVIGRLLLVRVDSTVDFDRGMEWPAGDHGAHPKSAQWTGWIKAPLSGKFRFRTNQPRTTLVVARQSMLGIDGGDGDPIELTAGRFYPITMRAEDLNQLRGRLVLEWIAPFGARYVVPRALLYVPTAS